MEWIFYYSPFSKYFNKHGGKIDRLCSYLNLGSWYITTIGIIGAVLTVADIIQILEDHTKLPDVMKRPRLTPDLVISIGKERDLKLITAVITIQYFLLLAYGALLEKSCYLVPWITIQSIIILLEFIIFIFRSLVLKVTDIYSFAKFCSVFAVFNWLQVLCYLRENCFSCCHY